MSDDGAFMCQSCDWASCIPSSSPVPVCPRCSVPAPWHYIEVHDVRQPMVNFADSNPTLSGRVYAQPSLPQIGTYINYDEQDAARKLTLASRVRPSAPAPADSSFRPEGEAPERVVFSPTWQEFYRDCLSVADRLLDAPVTAVLALARGGLVPATVVAESLGVVDVRSCRLENYPSRHVGQMRLALPLDDDIVSTGGAMTLVVDDLADSGVVMAAVEQLLPLAIRAVIYSRPEATARVHLFSRQVARGTWVRMPWEKLP